MGGLAIVTAMVVDLFGTLVITGGITAAWRPSRLFYHWTWIAWRAVGRRMKAAHRFERWLAIYAPLSMLSLLLMWLAGLAVGWALVYRGLLGELHSASDFLSLLYYSGSILLTPSFGEVTFTTAPAGMLTLVETVTGLGTIALLISYLPVLYGAYNRREARLLTLDDPSGERIMPVSLIELQTRRGGLDRLYRFFEEWELWTAEILESHVSYPMLAYFRSQHAGQSWITALGVVLDAATLAAAAIPDAEGREPYFMHRRGRRAVDEITLRLHVPQTGVSWMSRELFDLAYGRLRASGLPVGEADSSWQRLVTLRETYGVRLQSLIDYLVAPAGFWGHSADLATPS
ncbi:MAG TPA: hypothetical protein VMW62_15135 [Chloroflexota bacterium]|nr:hypothetical protein [Chloroflexota bacterium]